MTCWNEAFGVFNESAITYFSVAFQFQFLFKIPHVRFMGGITHGLACYHLLFFNQGRMKETKLNGVNETGPHSSKLEPCPVYVTTDVRK